MLRCEICQKPLKECCDLFHEAEDENGNSVVICYECAEEHKIPFEDDNSSLNGIYVNTGKIREMASGCSTGRHLAFNRGSYLCLPENH